MIDSALKGYKLNCNRKNRASFKYFPSSIRTNRSSQQLTVTSIGYIRYKDIRTITRKHRIMHFTQQIIDKRTSGSFQMNTFMFYWTSVGYYVACNCNLSRITYMTINFNLLPAPRSAPFFDSLQYSKRPYGHSPRER